LIAYRDHSRADIEFTAMNGVSIENLDSGIIALMKRAGFNELNISLVTRSPAFQDELGRPFHSDKFREIAVMAVSLGMKVRAYFILGLPGQTAAEVEDTTGFLRGLNVSVFPSVYYNVNSPMDEWKVQRSSAFFNETEHLSREDLLRLFNGTVDMR